MKNIQSDPTNIPVGKHTETPRATVMSVEGIIAPIKITDARLSHLKLDLLRDGDFIYTSKGREIVANIDLDYGTVNGHDVYDIKLTSLTWLHDEENVKYGFENIGSDKWKRGSIILESVLWDHKHVYRDNGEDLGRYYSAGFLEHVVLNEFGIQLNFIA